MRKLIFRAHLDLVKPWIGSIYSIKIICIFNLAKIENSSMNVIFYDFIFNILIMNSDLTKYERGCSYVDDIKHKLAYNFS